MTILIAWELGSNWGHLATLLPLAVQLRQAGHNVLFALRGLDGDVSLLHASGFDYVASPIAMAPLQQRHQQPVHGYADVLARCGFADARTLTQLTLAWQGLLRWVRPAVVVCKYAPLAEFATRSCPVLTIGTGFELPPLSTPLPLYGQTSSSPDVEDSILQAMQATAQTCGFAIPATAASAFAHAHRLCLSTPLLDHFGARPAMRYLGPVEDLPAQRTLSDLWPTPTNHQPLSFVYLRLGEAWLKTFAQAVAMHFPHRHWLVVDPGLSDAQCTALCNPQMTVLNQPVAWEHSLADSVICHGGHGMVAQALRLGLRLMVLPQHTEQLMLARRVAAHMQGLAVVPATVEPTRLVDVIAQWLNLPISAVPAVSAIPAVPPTPPLASAPAPNRPQQAMSALVNAVLTTGQKQEPTSGQNPAITPATTPATTPAPTSIPAPYTQLEITTRCNFSCGYCAGRDMPQQDMAWETFIRILDGLALPGTVSLQGEGEPSLHPQFWAMVAEVQRRGHLPYTILNGSRVDTQRIARSFPRIGISLDTLDVVEAEKIGRHNLPKVLANLEALCAVMTPQRIVVMTVNLGQPLDDLTAWVKQRGFASHIVQALMRKDDYAQRYAQHGGQAVTLPFPSSTSQRKPSPSNLSQICRFLQQDTMRYYTWDGLELPCCFIKDTQGIASIAGLRAMLGQGHVPRGCAGCQELKPLTASLNTLPLV